MITKIPKSVSGKYNLVIHTPDNYTKDKKYPLVVFLPGIGAKGDNMDALEREVPPNLSKWTGLGFIIVAVQTPDTYNDEVLFALNYALQNYSISSKYLTGLSYGGGGTWNFAAASLEQAKMFDAIAPIATTWTPGTWEYIANANLPVWAFHNLFDDNSGTPPDATRAMVAGVNKFKPGLAVMTLFKAYVHGGWGEAYDPVNPPVAAGGEGFTTAKITLPQWLLMNSATVRVPVPVSGPVVVQPTNETATILTADFNLTEGQMVTTPTIEVDASASVGVNSSWNGYVWDLKPLQGGSWGARPEGGAYGGPKKNITNLANGRYSLTLTTRDATGKSATKTITFNVSIAAKTLTGFSSTTDLITWSDGTTEKGEAIYSAGKWTIKTAAGKIITF